MRRARLSGRLKPNARGRSRRFVHESIADRADLPGIGRVPVEYIGQVKRPLASKRRPFHDDPHVGRLRRSAHCCAGRAPASQRPGRPPSSPRRRRLRRHRLGRVAPQPPSVPPRAPPSPPRSPVTARHHCWPTERRSTLETATRTLEVLHQPTYLNYVVQGAPSGHYRSRCLATAVRPTASPTQPAALHCHSPAPLLANRTAFPTRNSDQNPEALH